MTSEKREDTYKTYFNNYHYFNNNINCGNNNRRNI